MTTERPRSLDVQNDAAADQPETLDLRSRDLAADRVAQLRQIFPEVFREDRIDFNALQRSLGERVESDRERFGLTWPGKADCMSVIQQPSQGTLIPNREQSVDFDTTKNVVIEGDNLEVLKILQNSYYGKLKMIYIDPPYNTSNDFIYPDNFTEGLQGYLGYTEQINENGEKLTSRPDKVGRYHSNWLNMMYPRMFLARNLLRDDGVIFVSIDDNEMDNLRLLLDELFGEENLLAQVIWEKKYSPQNDARYFSDMHDYILVYARNKQNWKPGFLPRTDDQNDAYKNPDNDPRGPWKAKDSTCNKSKSERPTLYYPIRNPVRQADVWPLETRVWRYSRETHRQQEIDGRVWWGLNGQNTVPSYKSFLNEVRQSRVPVTIWKYSEVGHTQSARQQLDQLVPDTGFDTPKPVALIEHILKLGTSDDSIVMDFFAGSGTTGHAVMKLSAEDGGNRRYILVQLPEPVDNGGPYRTISEITRERLRRAGQQVREQAAKDGKDISGLDTGFQAYSLAESNFRQWQGDTASPEFGDGQLGMLANMERQLRLLQDNVRPDRSSRAILTEIMLAAGKTLTEPVEKIAVADQHAWSVAGGPLLICLERRIELATVRAMAERGPDQIVCLDASFAGSDKLRVNAAQAIRSWARQHDRTIAFRVV